MNNEPVYYYLQDNNQVVYYPQVTYRPQQLQAVLSVVITIALIVIIGSQAVKSVKEIL